MSLPRFVENRIGSSFIVSLTALVVALTTFFATSASQQSTTTTTAVATNTATNTATTGSAKLTLTASDSAATDTTTTTTTTTVAPPPIKYLADAIATVKKADTERATADANGELEKYKAETARQTAWWDILYKWGILVLATLVVLMLQRRITNLTFFGVIVELSPTPPPPPPTPAVGKAVMDATNPAAPRLALTHTVARSILPRQQFFRIRLQGELDRVSQVKYHLHPDYRETTRVVNTNPFGLDIPALGQFLLYADATLDDGSIVRLERYLNA